jgi:precorrin-3B C17-methyltransferase
MASIVLEVLEHDGADIEVEVIPGVTAANAAASRVGSPLSGDFAVISLSDLLTPLEVIEQRLEAIFALGIPVVLYNPKSRGRPHNFALAVEHARNHLGKDTPIAIVKNALREDEAKIITTLGEIEEHVAAIDMHTTVIIGGSESRIWRRGDDVKGIITPRGYHRKYVY